MGPIDMGPDWLWVLLAWLAGIGALCAVGGLIAGAWWLIAHVRFV